MSLSDQLASVKKSRMRRYRQLLSEGGELSDAAAVELDGLLRALGKSAAEMELDNKMLIEARSVQSELASLRELEDDARETSRELDAARLRHREAVAQANDSLRQHVEADNRARSLVVELRSKGQALAQLKKGYPELFAE